MADDFRQTIGGKGVNQAVAAARAGGSVAMVTCVGDDHHGQILLRRRWNPRALPSSMSLLLTRRPGVAVVMTATGGDNMIASRTGRQRPAASGNAQQRISLPDAASSFANWKYPRRPCCTQPG